MLKALATLPALLLAGIVFVVLFPILGVTLWVSFVAAGGAALMYALGAALVVADEGDGANNGGGVRMNPVVDVTLLRARYSIMLAVALAGGFLVVESYSFSQSVSRWIGFGIGIGIVAAAAAVLA